MQTVTGVITPHSGRGTQLGVPTVNCTVSDDVPDGVYAGYVVQQQIRYPAAIFVGAAVTFGDEDRQIEAHLLDRTTGVTGQVKFELVQYMRANQKFMNAQALRQQMDQDISAITQCLQELSHNN